MTAILTRELDYSLTPAQTTLGGELPCTAIPVEDAAARHDDDLKRRILNFLRQHHLPSMQNLRVQVKAGVVTVQGHAESFHQKQLCLNGCLRVPGVERLIDEVVVA